jgi:hypothetical protein
VADFFVKLGACLGGAAQACPQLFDLFALRARHAHQALGLAFAFRKFLAKLGQGRVRRLDARADRCPLGLRAAIPIACRDLDQGIAEIPWLVGASQGDVVGGLFGFALGQLGVDAQVGGGLVEFRDAKGQKRRLAEHAHLGKMRCQGVDHVVVGKAFAAIAVGHDAGQASPGRQQRQQRGKLDGAAAAQNIRGVGHQHQVEHPSGVDRASGHGDETQRAHVLVCPCFGHLACAARADYASCAQPNQMCRSLTRATADLKNAPSFEHRGRR